MSEDRESEKLVVGIILVISTILIFGGLGFFVFTYCCKSNKHEKLQEQELQQHFRESGGSSESDPSSPPQSQTPI